MEMSKHLIVVLRWNKKRKKNFLNFNLRMTFDIFIHQHFPQLYSMTFLTTSSLIDLSQLSRITCLLSRIPLFFPGEFTLFKEFSLLITTTRERKMFLYDRKAITDMFVVLFNNSMKITKFAAMVIYGLFTEPGYA